MKMRKKKEGKNGFTLVELIAIVVIISILFSVGSYFIGNIIGNSKNETTYLTNDNIMTSAELYVKESSKDIIWNEQNITYISIETLINKGYLEANKVEENRDKCVSIKKETNTYTETKIVDCSLSNKTIVEIPKSNDYCKNIVYDGTEKEITFTPGIGYSFLNNTKTNAGSYKVTATLTDKEKYIWEDETTNDKKITCSILKKTPELVLSSKGGPGTIGTTTIKFKSNDVDGKISIKSSNKAYATATTMDNNVTKGIEKDITINILATKKTNTIITFTFTPTDSNYKETSITYTIGEVKKVSIPVPTCNENLEYSGETIKLVPENSAYYLINNEKTAVGTYTVTAHLNYGYVWENNNNETDENPKEIQCTIENKSNTVTLDNQGATINSIPSVLTAKYNEMIPSITSIPTREYKVTFKYTVPISASKGGGTNSPKTVDVIYKYTFKGFYFGKNCTGEPYIDSTGTGIKIWDQTEDTTLYACWGKSTLTAPSVATPTGYDEIYWTATDDSSATKVTISKYHPTKDTILYGHILDTTAPQCEYTASGTQKIAKISNWYSSNVNLKYTCSDSGSGCQTNTEEVFNASGKNITSEGKFPYKDIYVYDNSGNKTKCPNVTIKIDKTAPTISVQRVSPNATDDGDDYQDFKHVIKGTINDNLSGISKASHSSCSKNISSSNYQSCSYSSGYGATNRLVRYLSGNTLSKDNKSTETYCKIENNTVTSPSLPYIKRYKQSWTKFQVAIFVQDMAGNIKAILVKKNDASSNAIETTDITSYFSNYTDCKPKP